MLQKLTYLPLLFLPMFLAASLLFSAPLHAQVNQSTSEARVLDAAHKSAILAGGARFCNVDHETIDEFIGIAEARITLLAKDDYEKIIGRLEFKNLLTAFSAKEPEGGCEKFVDNFKFALKASN